MNEKPQTKQMKYLHQYWSAVHKTETFAAENCLDSSLNSEDTPAYGLHSQFSCVRLGIIDHSDNNITTVLKACFKAGELPYFFEQYDFANRDKRAYLNARKNAPAKKSAPAAQSSPAYTVTIRIGEFKDKTPASVLISNPSNAPKLESSRNWMNARVAEHPENKAVIDAIDEALALLRAGKLTEGGASKPDAEDGMSDADTNSPAYTVVLWANDALKGKTPADILISDPSKKELLERHMEWLEENLQKYPRNQDAIDAILDALYLMECGTLKPKRIETATENSCVVFDAPYKLMSGGAPDKKVRCELTVSCLFDRRNPWCFRIVNTTVEAINGKIDDSSRVLSRNSATMYLNDSEMAEFVYMTRTMLRLHEDSVAPDARAFVEKYRWRPD